MRTNLKQPGRVPTVLSLFLLLLLITAAAPAASGQSTAFEVTKTSDSSSLMRVLDNGKVGIGATSPEATVHVGDQSSLPGNVYGFTHSMALESTGSTNLIIAGTTGHLTLYDHDATAEDRAFLFRSDDGKLLVRAVDDDLSGTTQHELLTLDHSNGYVGIGTDSPDRTLEIFSSATQSIPLDINSTHSNAVGIRLLNRQPNKGWYFATEGSNGDFELRDHGETITPLTVLQTSGNVGIGATSPATTLEVSNVLRLTPTDAPGTCSGTLKGSMYFDDSLSEPCFCNGVDWVQFDSGSVCT